MPNIEYDSAFMHAPIGLCVAQQRIIRSCNFSLAEMFGYAYQQLLNESLLTLYPTLDEFERIKERLVPALSATGSYSDDRIMKRSNGEMFWCHVRGRTLNRSDPLAASIWSFEDLSETRPVTITLSPREREISSFLVSGQTSKKIARELNLSPRTVEMYRAKLLKKYGATTTSEFIQRMLTSSAH